MSQLTREEKLASFQQLTKVDGIKTGREFAESFSNKARILINHPGDLGQGHLRKPDRLTPHLALSVIYLSKIKHLTLHNLAAAGAPVFHKIPIAVLLHSSFFFLLSRGAAQKHGVFLRSSHIARQKIWPTFSD